MAEDIRLITLLPAQTIPGVTQPQLPAGVTPQATPALANLPGGTVLSGFIVNRDPSGNPILRTDKGDIVFQTGFFLKIGSEVVVRVENAGGRVLARLLSVDGQPPEIAEKLSAFDQEPDIVLGKNASALPARPAIPTATAPAAPPQQQAAVQVAVRPSVVVGATLVTPAPDIALPAGTPLLLKVVALDTPAPALPTAVTTPPNANPATPVPLSPSTTTATTTPTPSPGNAVSVPYAAYAKTLIATTPPIPLQLPEASGSPPLQTTVLPSPPNPAAASVSPPPPSLTAPLQPGQSLPATVISNDPVTSQTLVQTPVGLVRLQPGVTLPVSAKVTFELVPASAQAALPATPAPAPITELARHWESLQQIVTLLSTSQGAAATGLPPSLSQKTAPTPPALTAGLLVFLAALRGGDFANWLGAANARRIEDEGYGHLLKKASAEFMTLSRHFVEAAPQHWQPLFFPVFADGAVQQIRLYVKRDRKQGSQAPMRKAEDETRFVLEFDLSQMGEMQLDGFVRRREKDLQFDLVIRSLLPLSEEIQQDILKIYTNTGAITGYRGGLAFQYVKTFPIHPMEEIAAGTADSVIA